MRITLYGFYNYDPTLFDNVNLPEGIEKDYVIDEIMNRSGDMFPYHQEPTFLKRNITNWFNRNYYPFERMITALTEEYSPIENYDRHQKDTTTPKEKVTEQHSGTDSNAHTGTITDAHTGTITDAHSGTITDAHTGTITDAHSGTITDAHTGTITDAHSGTVTDAASGTDTRTITSTPGVTDTVENTVSAYDSSTYSPKDKTQTSHTGFDQSTDQMVNGKTNTQTLNNSDTRTHADTDTQTLNNSDTRTHADTDTQTLDNSDTRTHADTDTRTHADTEAMTHGHKIETTNSGTREFESHIHGNIGVTTSTAMISELIDARNMSLAEMLLDNFINDYTFYS